MNVYHSVYKLGDWVYIDDDTSIKGVVTTVQFSTEKSPLLEVSWMHNGTAQSAWIQEWRLEMAS